MIPPSECVPASPHPPPPWYHPAPSDHTLSLGFLQLRPTCSAYQGGLHSVWPARPHGAPGLGRPHDGTSLLCGDSLDLLMSVSGICAS